MVDLNDLIDLDGPVSQEKIREIRQSGLDLIAKARAIQQLGQAKLQLARNLCSHPKKSGYVCPDCGLDTGPDGY